MACVYDSLRADSIIQDPYAEPLAHGMRTGFLFGLMAFTMSLTIFCMGPKCLRLGPWDLTKKMCCSYLCLSSLGFFLEATTTIFLSENDGFALIVIARMLLITSLAPLLAAATGMAESVWPSKLWPAMWILGILYLVASLAAFLTISILEVYNQLLTLAFIMGTGCLYCCLLWVLVIRMISLPPEKCAMVGPVGALMLLGCYLWLGLSDVVCGPSGHQDCYKQCWMGRAGTHYIIFFGATGMANMLLAVFLRGEEPQAKIAWPLRCGSAPREQSPSPVDTEVV